MSSADNISSKTRLLDFFRFFFRVPIIERLLIWLKSKSYAFAKLVPNYYQYKHHTFRNFTRGGISFRTDISDWLGYCAYFNIKNEPYDCLFAMVKPGMEIMDIGSNIGFTALNMAALLENDGIVYAFEPDKYNFSVLSNNIQLNKDLPVKAFQLGLGNSTETLKLVETDPRNRGENKITGSTTSSEYSMVNIVRLDDFVSEQHIGKIDLIKIDTEGFEMNVLKGAEKIIASSKPLLFIEINDTNLKEQGASAMDVVAHLSALGYEITSAQTGERMSTGANLSNCHFDAICKPKI